MTGIIQGLFGGDSSAEAEKARQQAAVSNDRQLADLNRQNRAISASRRPPRGQRLFTDGPDSLGKTLGSS